MSIKDDLECLPIMSHVQSIAMKHCLVGIEAPSGWAQYLCPHCSIVHFSWFENTNGH